MPPNTIKGRGLAEIVTPFYQLQGEDGELSPEDFIQGVGDVYGSQHVILYDANGNPILTDGKVGHDVTGIWSGRKEVAAPGAPERLVDGNTPAKSVIVTAETNNTSVVVVGSGLVDAVLLTRKGTPLFAGESVTLLCDDLFDIYIDALVATEGVTFNALT